MSLEQQPDFLLLRRILRSVCPLYVIYTKADLPAGRSLIDVERQSIILSEHTDLSLAICAALFQIGKVMNKLNLPEDSGGDQSHRAIANALNRHDSEACRWAQQAFAAFWPDGDQEEARQYIAGHVMSSVDWYRYIAP